MIHFHESYRQVDWEALLHDANHSLHIMVYYWDKWVHKYEKALKVFLHKPQAQIHFFFSQNLEEVQRLFPSHTKEELVSKIEKTFMPLQQFGKVHVYDLPTLLNYSMQCIDNKTLVLSFFEMHRTPQVDAPGLVIDLTRSPHLQQFYQKELQGILSSSTERTFSQTSSISTESCER